MKNNRSVRIIVLSGLLLAALTSIGAYYTKGNLHRYFIFISESFIIFVAVYLLWHISKRMKNAGKRLLRILLVHIQTSIKKANPAVARYINGHGVRIRHYQDSIEMLTLNEKNKKGLYFILYDGGI